MIRTSQFLVAVSFALTAALAGASSSFAAGFTPGNLVIYRVGDGTGSLVNTGNAVFLDEYTTSGTLVQSVALPTSASGSNQPLIASGTATSEGLLTRSANGHYLLLTGYGRAPGGTGSVVSTASATVPRIVGRVDAGGTIDTTTALTDYADANNPRSVTSDNGTNLWVTGAAGGVRYTTVGSTTSTGLSTTVANLRQANIFNGQLYISTSSGSAVRLGAVGAGLPAITGQTITNLPAAFETSSGSPYGFYFADLSPNVAGLDTLYVADDAANQGIQKWTLDGTGAWALTGTITANGARGITAVVDGTNVSLFATTGGSTATGGGTLWGYSDTAGYGSLAVGATAAMLATAGSNEAFRGIAFAPTAVPEPASLAIVSLAATAALQRRRRRPLRG